MKDKNMDRFIITDESAMLSPKDSIICNDCIFRNMEPEGFKKSRCKKYVDEIKPLKVLFEDDICQFYKKN